jgi:two-component system, sensor histidine kinase
MSGTVDGSLNPRGPAHNATFHVRVAGVGLITTVVVLAAACLTFMLQQWAVAKEQNHVANQALARMTAYSAAPHVASGDVAGAQTPLNALADAPRVLSAQLISINGQPIANYRKSGPPVQSEHSEVIRADVKSGGTSVGELVLVAQTPLLSTMMPQFVALTFALLFGGVGVALFLARGMAHRIIAPVQRLSEAMEEKSATGGFEPVEVTARDQLFRSLTDSFNQLLGSLAERDADLKKAMGELVEARDVANAANVLKTQFLANMSHEIRTPLNGVLAMAEVMSMSDLEPVQRERLDVIRQSGALLLAVLNDVLDLSKIEAGKLTLLEDDFDLETALAPAAASFGVMAQGKSLAFGVTVDPSAQGWWRGDADRLRQIVGNLMSNAVKFTQQGSVETLVDVNPATGALRLTVRDTGVGIPLEKQATLFEKFTQADNSATRRFGGTGLGLAICRELTQMMDGVISVESGEGQGATFTVELPLERGQAVEVAAPESAEQAEEGALRLLAAEDNATNQQVLAAVMDSLGIEIDIVGDGQQAVDAWREGAYDLILMDIQMPVMDGIDAAKAIRAAERAENRRRTPIVALTANALSHQVQEYLAAGMDGHVPKPIEIAKLYDAISRALNEAAMAAHAAA